MRKKGLYGLLLLALLAAQGNAAFFGFILVVNQPTEEPLRILLDRHCRDHQR